MIIFLFFIPVLTVVSAGLLYGSNGKREFLKFDLVQFIYAFFLTPLLFITLKTFIFLSLKNEVEVILSQKEIFIIDTIFSLLFLYIFAFVVVHAFTKSINLKVSEDPLFDIFHLTEYFHLWFTHLTTFVGGLFLLTVVSMINVFFPVEVEVDKFLFRAVVGSGILGGVFAFMGVWLSDPRQEGKNFMRFMKLVFGFFFLIHTVVYFALDPAFSSEFIIYWWSMFAFATLVVISLFMYKSVRAKSFFETFFEKMKHNKWDFNTQVFEKK